MTRFVLAHDVGTTGDKATLHDEQGTLIGSAFVPYATSYPHPGWAEQNPDDWWRSFCLATRRLLQESQIDSGDIACVSFSGQMMGAVAVDDAARPLRAAIIWADQRAVAQVEKVAEGVDPRHVYARTGHRLSPSYSGGKIRWLKEVESAVYAATHKFLQAKDFLVARLTDTFATDPSDASGTNLYDLENGRWSDELVEAFEIDPDKLPAILPSTAIAGELRSHPAEEAGLRPGTPVVIGGGDGACASAGAGVIGEGLAYAYIGASSWIALATPRPIIDPEMRTFTFAHLIPGMFMPCGTMQAAGASYQWARDELSPAEKLVAERLGIAPYDLLNEEVRRSPPGAHGLVFLPYLLGERSPRWNPEARGAFVGLTIRHRHADLVRAVLEGVTFNLRVILDAFERQGAQIEALRVIGGGARGLIWNEIMADVFGLPVHRLSQLEAATSMGAALAGGIGIGLWKDFSQVDTMVRVESECRPNEEHHRLYTDLYRIFNDAYTALDEASIFSKLAAIDR